MLKLFKDILSNSKSMLLSKKIKDLRLSKLAQQKNATALNVDNAAYCKLENNVLRISREQFLIFTKFLNADRDTLTMLWLANQVKKIVEDNKNKKEVAKDAMDAYPENVVLAVNPKSKEVFIENSDKCNECDIFSLSILISKNEDGNSEPDSDATCDLASQYCFVI